ncbi:hypothetical protein CHS0354_001274, partial [Potamilus streckersoni]
MATCYQSKIPTRITWPEMAWLVIYKSVVDILHIPLTRLLLRKQDKREFEPYKRSGDLQVFRENILIEYEP